MQITLNSTATMHCNVLTDIAIAKQAGFDAVEIIHQKLYRFLDEGGKITDLKKALGDMPVVGVGALWNADRPDEEGLEQVKRETRRMSDVARTLGCDMVQAVPGPVDIGLVKAFYAGTLKDTDEGYRGYLGQPWTVIRKGTAKNVKEIAKILKDNGQDLYLEPLGWAPFNSLKQAMEVIDEAEMDNVGVIVDTWHCYVSGDTPDFVAKMDKKLIKGVHVCDSLRHDGGVPDQDVLRNVLTGEGAIYLKEWMDAIRATGFDGWYACELFSRRHHEMDPLKLATTLRNFLEYII